MKHDIRILKENWENFLKEAHQPHKVTINGKEVNVDSIKHDMQGDWFRDGGYSDRPEWMQKNVNFTSAEYADGTSVSLNDLSKLKQQNNDYLMSLGQAPIKSESSAFNDAGEPIMTHNQFRDFSEPSENDEDDRYNNDEINISREFINEMKKNNIFVEENFGKEYFIRCKEHEDFMIYFPDDETIEIYDTKHNSQKQEFRYEDAVDYVLKNKEHLLTFDESVKERDQEFKIDAQDRKNNRAEMGGGLA